MDVLLFYDFYGVRKPALRPAALLRRAGVEARTRFRTHKSYAFAGPPTSLI